MRHDELLAIINEERTFANAEALRAVVELCKRTFMAESSVEPEYWQGVRDQTEETIVAIERALA